ncbi:hypothetical protein [Cochlodiniinecator piscidefendens]|uniref:hypothetical protein n=1 Tax=Cochlodiniinecator piscidefendens TaxID=2715756 RepID=UPI00140CE3FD|nr:hypothetical protein [Cochlodiniinecator piscidefendens]
MTALKEYQRLESIGLWRESPDAQRREVVVSFGNATLVISDKNDVALTHWSLAAIRRINPNKTPALFSPDIGDLVETLELDDPQMIEAVERVLAAITKTKKKSGKLRFLFLVPALAAVVSLSVFWLPDALREHAVRITPDVTRVDIGNRLLGHITRLTGEKCSSLLGNRALTNLRNRLSPEIREFVVLRSGIIKTENLPGGYILLNRSLVEDYEEPEVAAGYVLAERQRISQRDPMDRFFETLGFFSQLQFLTTGNIAEEDLERYAEMLAVYEVQHVPEADLLPQFTAANVSTSPYAYAVDISGETTISLIEADPYSNEQSRPVLSDGNWISLQSICSE